MNNIIRDIEDELLTFMSEMFPIINQILLLNHFHSMEMLPENINQENLIILLPIYTIYYSI